MNARFLCWIFISIYLAAASSLQADSDLVVSGVPQDSPIAITATATATDLMVHIEIEPEWHVFCRDVGGGQPVTITIDPGSAMVATGDLQMPQSDSGKLTGAIQLCLPIGLGNKAEANRLQATLRLQVCDALECLPPMEIKVSGEIPALKVLLVVGAKDERTQRIEEWLSARRFEINTRLYTEVEKPDCEAHDVVLADSNLFGKTTARRAVIHKFPKSETPLVAVGFNGTELIEAHKIAMTSGYI